MSTPPPLIIQIDQWFQDNSLTILGELPGGSTLRWNAEGNDAGISSVVIRARDGDL